MGGTQGGSVPVSGVFMMSSAVKYIPINFFNIFDSAHLDSDEFSLQCQTAGSPPALFREVGD